MAQKDNPFAQLGRLQCRCMTADGIRVLREHLGRSAALLRAMEEPSNTRRLQQLSSIITALQKAARELEAQVRAHDRFREDYARDMVVELKERLARDEMVATRASGKRAAH